jgi:hypothetical protein
MEGNGNSALTAAAPHGGTLQAAAVPDAELRDADFPFDAVDAFADGGFPYDDDPNFVYADDVSPEDPFPEALFADDELPEDPFPEALFADVMFADAAAASPDGRGPRTPRPALADRIAAARALLTADLTADSPGLIDQTHAFENIKSMLAGQQARLSVAFEIRHRQEQAELGTQAGPGQANRSSLPAEDLGKKRPKEHGLGAAEQIALARGESPHRGGRLLGMSKALVTEMPHTLAALDTGQLNEERAMHVVKETACLTVADRTAVDEELAADTGTLTGAGTRTVIATVRAAATRRDPRSVTQRASHAVSERSVSLRPAPDCMTYLTALLPAHQGVAMYTALTRHADTLHAAGDPRSLGQIKADTLVERTTGTPGGITGIEINLVITDRTLLQGDSEPARLTGYGTVPAPWARNLLNQEPTPEHPQAQGQEPRTGGPNTPDPTTPDPTTSDPTTSDPTTGQKGRHARTEDLAPPALHRTRDRRPRRHGLPTAALPGTTAPLHPDPRRHLPHPILRRPHPPPRPHHPLAQRRPHHPGQRRRTLRSLQPHQRTPRLENPTQTRPPTHHRNHHTHRPHLPLHSTTTARIGVE